LETLEFENNLSKLKPLGLRIRRIELKTMPE
jgi:hypothetical protein